MYMGLFVSPDDTSLCKIVRGQLHGDLVTGKDPDEILAKSSAYCGKDLMSVLKFYLEHGIGKLLNYYTADLDYITF